jgi:hypothetical protein
MTKTIDKVVPSHYAAPTSTNTLGVFENFWDGSWTRGISHSPLKLLRRERDPIS